MMTKDELKIIASARSDLISASGRENMMMSINPAIKKLTSLLRKQEHIDSKLCDCHCHEYYKFKRTCCEGYE